MADVKINPAIIPVPIADLIARSIAEAVKRAEKKVGDKDEV